MNTCRAARRSRLPSQVWQGRVLMLRASSSRAALESSTESMEGALTETLSRTSAGQDVSAKEVMDQLDAAHAASSQLHVLAGSWGKAFHPFPSEEEQARLPIVALETEPGDATVHFGCGLHAGPGPTGSQRRRTLYVQHYHPRTFELIGPHAGYNQIMPGYGQGQIPNFDELRATE